MKERILHLARAAGPRAVAMRRNLHQYPELALTEFRTASLARRLTELGIDIKPGAETHLPAREGFVSRHPGLMHACGHDGHTAMGLGIAEVLAPCRDELFFIACHLGMDAPCGTFHPQVEGFLASTKFDCTFRGQAAHAGGAPQDGRKALAAAAYAVLAAGHPPPPRRRVPCERGRPAGRVRPECDSRRGLPHGGDPRRDRRDQPVHV